MPRLRGAEKGVESGRPNCTARRKPRVQIAPCDRIDLNRLVTARHIEDGGVLVVVRGPQFDQLPDLEFGTCE